MQMGGGNLNHMLTELLACGSRFFNCFFAWILPNHGWDHTNEWRKHQSHAD